MTKQKNFSVRIADQIYETDMVICVGEYKFYQNYLKKYHNEKPKEQCFFGGESQYLLSEYKGKLISENVVWIPRLDFTYSNCAVLAHEILHSVFHLFKVVGIKLDYENHEAINYYFEFLYRESLLKLSKYYNKSRKK